MNHSPQRWQFCVMLALALGRPVLVQAQETDLTVADSKVSFIDNAIPGNVFRFRFDDAFNLDRPNRAEFFYPQGGPGGRGLPLPEKRVDYQELSLYGEHLLLPTLSGFIQKPVRLLNPEVNGNHAGLSDFDGGLKWAFFQDERTSASLQFRTYIPTGNPHFGLGSGHFSVEPGLLLYRGLTERLALAGELRYWAPIGSSDFAGDIVRYGLGLQYLLYEGEKIRVSPVTEVVGWSVLGGKETVVFPSGQTQVRSAAGDTIVNINVGIRFALGNRCDLYTGFGQALTGDRWYQDIFRTEFRFFY